MMNKNTLLEKIIRTGSVKNFREALIEASRSFALGSAADLVYNFYKVTHSYYENLLVYQFQLYSDLPPYILGIVSIRVYLGSTCFSFSFGTRKNKFLSSLQKLNDVPFENVTNITYMFELAPSLKNFVAATENNVNSELFKKQRSFSVAKGDGTYITGSFEPEWNEKGFVLKCTGINRDVSKPVYMMQLGSSIQ